MSFSLRRSLAASLLCGLLSVGVMMDLVIPVAAASEPVPASVIEQGRLLLQWGDPRPADHSSGGAGMPNEVRTPANAHAPWRPRMRVQLITDDGRRIPLDASQARRAAADLSGLNHRRVALSFADHRAGANSATTAATRTLEAIVPIDDLSPGANTATGQQRQARQGARISGNTRWISLMCKFSDITLEQKPRDYFQQQYAGSAGRLGQYWHEVSYGHVSLAGSSAHGWFTLPHPRSHYLHHVAGRDNLDTDRLFQDCVSAADGQVNFSGSAGVNLMFNGELDGYAWGGSACGMMDGRRQCTRATWNPPWSFDNLATLAHQMGHGYGLPHSDNDDGDSDTYDNPWDLMSDVGSYAVLDSAYGKRPKHMAMIQRDRLGWVDTSRKWVVPYGAGFTQRLELQYASLTDARGLQMLVLSMPVQPDPSQTVRYTVEARRRSGEFEAGLAGEAVIIHRIHDNTAYSQHATALSADRANHGGSMLKVGESWNEPSGAYAVRVNSVGANGLVVTVTARGVQAEPVTGANGDLRRGAVAVRQPVAVKAPTAGTRAALTTAVPAQERSSTNPRIRKDKHRPPVTKRPKYPPRPPVQKRPKFHQRPAWT